MPLSLGQVLGSLAGGRQVHEVGSIGQQEIDNVFVPIVRGEMKRSPPIVFSTVHVSLFDFDQFLCKIVITRAVIM